MSKYIEIDSTYRDRTLYPQAGSFEVNISPSGRKNAKNAIDPVCLSYPIFSWTSRNFSITGATKQTVTATVLTLAGGRIAGVNDQQTFIIQTTVEAIQQLQNYYLAAVIRDTTIGEERRITSYKFIGRAANITTAEITVQSAFGSTFAEGDTVTINDPTDLTFAENPLFFVPNGRNGEKAYYGCVLYNETRNQYRTIINYDTITHILNIDVTGATQTVSNGPINIAPVWANTDNYSILNEAFNFFPLIGAGSTSSSIVLTGGSSSATQYIGSFIRIPVSGTYNYVVVGAGGIPAPETESRRITSYDPVTKKATVSPFFSVAPTVGNVCQVLQFSYDNVFPLAYNGSTTSQQDFVCYEVGLLNLVLPNANVLSPYGDKLFHYPYVYVELSNVSSGGNKNSLYSNNPNSTKTTFHASIDNITNPNSTSFIKIYGDGGTQVLKFKPNDDLKFSVTLPNGEIFDTDILETYSPSEPNAMAQISALFSIKRL
jgi:hypothetical protein